MNTPLSSLESRCKVVDAHKHLCEQTANSHGDVTLMNSWKSWKTASDSDSNSRQEFWLQIWNMCEHLELQGVCGRCARFDRFWGRRKIESKPYFSTRKNLLDPKICVFSKSAIKILRSTKPSRFEISIILTHEKARLGHVSVPMGNFQGTYFSTCLVSYSTSTVPSFQNTTIVLQWETSHVRLNHKA